MEVDNEEDVTPPRSTKRPLHKNQKVSAKSKEDCLMDLAISVLSNAGSKKKEIDADDAFGQHVALTLRAESRRW